MGRGRRALAPPPEPGPAEGPELFPLATHPGPAGAGAVPDRRHAEVGGPGVRAGPSARDGRCPGEPRALLRDPRLPDVPEGAGPGRLPARADRRPTRA